MKAVYTYCVLALLFLASCGKNIDYAGLFYTINESPDERFAQSMKYNDEHGYDTITGVPDDYEVYVMSDIHVDFSTDNLDRFVSDYLADSVAAPFAICLGDLINATDHWDYFDEHVKPVSDVGRKIYYTVGNHDLYFDQWPEFRSRYHTSTYWFEVQTVSNFKDLYISIDSGNGTLGVDQRDWLEDVLREKKNQGYRHTIVYTHTHFFKKDTSQGHTSNFNLEETYDLLDLFDRYDVSLVLQGHSHSRDLTTFKDVVYLRVDALEDHYPDAYYTILNVGNHIYFEFINVY
ncbi:MAG: metallophosphoesterase [Bacteroidales bacterium]|nr:metallophosphoesterase [Bacteroidales bacterium]